MSETEDTQYDRRRKTVRNINRQRRHRNFGEDGKPLSGQEVIQVILEETGDTCLLSFSGGKDSLSAWLTIREHFQRVIPFYVYRIPRMRYIDHILDQYERYFNTEIIRVPAPVLYRMMIEYCYIPPNRWPIIASAGLQRFKWIDLEHLIKRHVGVPEETFTATGIRAVDNIQRRIAVSRYGPIHWGKRHFMPIWDMYKAEVVDLLEKHGIPLSVEYQWYGHSFGGLDYRFMKPLSVHSPADWRQVCAYFPLIYLELARYDDLERPYPYGTIEEGHVDVTAPETIPDPSQTP